MKSLMRPEARAEFDEAVLYYERQREDLGDEFIEDFLLAMTEIEEAPGRWPEIDPGIRRFLMSRFPYRVIYRLANDLVEVIAVSHSARHPDHWRDRPH